MVFSFNHTHDPDLVVEFEPWSSYLEPKWVTLDNIRPSTNSPLPGASSLFLGIGIILNNLKSVIGDGGGVGGIGGVFGVGENQTLSGEMQMFAFFQVSPRQSAFGDIDMPWWKEVFLLKT